MSLEWFRWYHGTVSDPKFGAVARKSKQPKIAILAVWSAVLEYASQAKDRGSLTDLDPDVLAACLDMDEEAVASILEGMTAKGLIADGRVAAWNKRQVRRDRDDDSRERVAAHRNRKKVTPGNATVTPSNATREPVTPPVTHVTGIESESDTDTDTDLDSTSRGTNKSRRQSARNDEILTTTTDGDFGFFTLTPARIELAKARGFTDTAWVEKETERFIERTKTQVLGNPDKAWLAWLAKGESLGLDHRREPRSRPARDDFPLAGRPHL